MKYIHYHDITVLKFQTIIDIKILDKEEIIFTLSTGRKIRMTHEQDCCESVEIEDINGDLSDLLEKPILLAEEVEQEKEIECGSQTWTFYKLATIKGTVTLRWLGESNGYYSESVDIIEEVEK